MNVQNWLSDIAKAIQEKTKTTKQIFPSEFASKIREIKNTGGGGGAIMEIPHEGEYTTTQVPNTGGYVDRIYFNTDLTENEVVSLIEQADLTYTEMMYPVATTPDGKSILIICLQGMCAIIDGLGADMTIFFSNVPDFGNDFIGWNPNIDFSLGYELAAETMDISSMGAENEKLISLVGISPFIKQPSYTEDIEIEGTLDGSEVYLTDLKPKWTGVPGTAIPQTGLVENVYCNIDVSIEEVNNILSQLDYADVTGQGSIFLHSILTCENGSIGIGIMRSPHPEIENEFNYVLLALFNLEDMSSMEDLVLYVSCDTEMSNDGTSKPLKAGWQTLAEDVLIFNKEAETAHAFGNPSGVQNDLLNSILSITPFEKTEKNTIDILSYLENNKLPNKISIKEDTTADNIISGLLSEYKGNVVTIRPYGFYDAKQLSYIKAPNCITVQEAAFAFCESLETAIFPSSFEVTSSAFYSCRSLINTDFTACQSVGSSAFAYCSKLTEISFPKCSYIGSYAFQNCTQLSAIYLLNPNDIVSLASSNAFTNTPITNSTYLSNSVYGSIYVPASKLDSYKTAANWSYFSDRFTGV